MDGLEIADFPTKFKITLVDNWAVVFGAEENLTNKDLIQKMIFITAPWDMVAHAYNSPWELVISAQPWRIGEPGDMFALAAPVDDPQWQQNEVYPILTQCAAVSPTSVEATRYKEIHAMLKFGRDSNWPLVIIMYSLGLAPEWWLASPDKRA
jgi:hypothetical protein